MSGAKGSEELTTAGLYDFHLGGNAHTDAERKAGQRLLVTMPELRDAASANRGFLQRSARWIAEEGVDQFIDLGAGLPTQVNTHEVVAQVNPDARVVYVDSDPRVKERGTALLEAAGVTTVRCITADLRDPDSVLNNPDVQNLIDFDRPVGVLMVAVLHFIPDEQQARRIITRYMDAAAAGSYLAVSHVTADGVPEKSVRAILDLYKNTKEEVVFRSRDEVKRLFPGLDLVPVYPGREPGVGYLGEWGAEDPESADSEGSRRGFCGVGRRP